MNCGGSEEPLEAGRCCVRGKGQPHGRWFGAHREAHSRWLHWQTLGQDVGSGGGTPTAGRL